MPKEKMNIVVFSGDMDKVLAAFIIATTAAAMGMEVNMFFTFWGLNVLRKKKFTAGKNVLQKMMNAMNRGGSARSWKSSPRMKASRPTSRPGAK